MEGGLPVDFRGDFLLTVEDFLFTVGWALWSDSAPSAALQGFIYQDFKPVFWSPSSRLVWTLALHVCARVRAFSCVCLCVCEQNSAG